MHTIPDTTPPRRSVEPIRIWPTVAIALLATAGAIVLGVAAPPASTAALSAGRSAAAPATRDVSSVDARCRA